MNTSYRLLKDVANPEHDKRCTSGYKKFPTLKAGTFFEGRRATVDADGLFDPAFVYCPQWRTIGGDLAALIIGNSEPAEPTNWDEIAIAAGGYHHFADDVLDRLIKEGAVTLEQVKQALHEILES